MSAGLRLTHWGCVSEPAAHSRPLTAGLQSTRVGGNMSSWSQGSIYFRRMEYLWFEIQLF